MKPKLSGVCAVLAIALFSYMLSTPLAREAAPNKKVAPGDSLETRLKSKAAAVFKNSCAISGCHSGKHPRMHLSLEPGKMPDAVKDKPSGEIDSLMLVDTKRPDKSYLLMKVRAEKGIRGERMPADAPPLKADAVRTIELWVKSLSAQTR